MLRRWVFEHVRVKTVCVCYMHAWCCLICRRRQRRRNLSSSSSAASWVFWCLLSLARGLSLNGRSTVNGFQSRRFRVNARFFCEGYVCQCAKLGIKWQNRPYQKFRTLLFHFTPSKFVLMVFGRVSDFVGAVNLLFFLKKKFVKGLQIDRSSSSTKPLRFPPLQHFPF